MPHPEQDQNVTAPAFLRAVPTDQVCNLIVIANGQASLHELPPSGSLLVGRSSFADLQIDDPSISRRHATIRVLGGRVSIEDLESANGTRVAGERLEPGTWAGVLPGEPVELGSVTVVLSRNSPPAECEVDRGVLFTDPKMREIDALLEKVAPSNLPILLLGETGVGKEVLAERAHALSGRSGRFIALNCAAITETLLESEIFGHEAGAFTGAMRTKQGLLESAHGGTVLIDEVGELPAPMQVKLLRVLETKQVTRVGGLRPLNIDVRFIAATNRDLDAEVQAGRFRSDLYFRLAGMEIVVPPLRDRPADLEPLIESFLRAAAEERGRPRPEVSEEALRVMLDYGWPGNVRELRHAVERATLLAEDRIGVEHLPPLIAGSAVSAGSAGASKEEPRVLRSEVRAVERDAILGALDRCAGNQSEAAKHLGISRRTLGERMDDFGIPRPRKGRAAR